MIYLDYKDLNAHRDTVELPYVPGLMHGISSAIEYDDLFYLLWPEGDLFQTLVRANKVWYPIVVGWIEVYRLTML